MTKKTTPIRDEYRAAKQALADMDRRIEEDEDESTPEVEVTATMAHRDSLTARLSAARDALIASDEVIEYTVRDRESGVTTVIEARTDADAELAAAEWTRDGYERGGDGDDGSTWWVDVDIARETDDGYVSGRGSDDEVRVTVTIEAEERRR